jgi:hypothetical protein
MSMELEVLYDRAQWMVAYNYFHGPIGAQQEQAGRLATLRQHGEQVQRGMITPVQVFEDQDE